MKKVILGAIVFIVAVCTNLSAMNQKERYIVIQSEQNCKNIATLLNPNMAKYFYQSDIVTKFRNGNRRVMTAIDFGNGSSITCLSDINEAKYFGGIKLVNVISGADNKFSELKFKWRKLNKGDKSTGLYK